MHAIPRNRFPVIVVAAHRIDRHRALGIGTAIVGVLLAVTALDLGIVNVAAGRAPPGRDPLQLLWVQVGTTTIFALFLVGALALRKQREWHKRLMFLATLALIVPASGRFDSLITVPLGLPRGVISLWVSVAFVACALWNDWRMRGRGHAAYLSGGLLLVASLPLRRWMGMQEWRTPIAQWLVS